MENIFQTYKPDNFHTVTPYLFVDQPNLLIEFLKNTFFAKEINRSVNPATGDIANCILQIGDTCFMISQARAPFDDMKTALYLFVDDVEALHKRAVAYGAKVDFEPADMPYQDRRPESLILVGITGG
ncbi:MULTISPECIES: VOC family protein [Chryseobacterium]|uniref:PhnB protein n=1 Tax=Chryseobacterium camelliae TaxID=1265445 RepID=A0ABU0TMS2_9FLAO|nr:MULTISPECIES: VOC family protein [Chryseobacterium]MDT3408550.1 PhnB protein [Pseudacidovorax intermedius]MDQ1097595.1 PhnB protein [Chryseobacterium camelliae]MDQ1101524.1 PhnB protein [Chryseobacterium sp. SORGH_AS_1048]MDR6084967.1 PhnB protein [Chryseobacterium sp. SORGH_AS_0909]MDR6129320.1 PhnB protein [Chryseobacterium sp. SORGH_AS_1175]